MLCINGNITEPWYNLALEEYMLRNLDDEVCFIWQSTPSVIVGKHQNALAEINYRFVVQKEIVVARRMTGGGTVYHDPGNLNFSFIRKGEPGKMIDFRKHTGPVVEFLRSRGIQAYPGPKNEILLNDLKISGNAEHIYRKRVLHHGTLLFNTNLDNLRDALNADPQKYLDKSVKSVYTD